MYYLRLIKAFQFVEKHGEVCPANWTPDSPTIKPDPKEIARILFNFKNLRDIYLKGFDLILCANILRILDCLICEIVLKIHQEILVVVQINLK